MPRPKSEQPTPGELEILKILWDRGPAQGRDVMDLLNQDGKDRAYTSVTSLMNVMVDKGLLRRKPHGRAFVYEAILPRQKTLAGLLHDLVGRAFEGSASALVAHLLDDVKLTPAELAEIRRTLDEHSGA
jgi:BlaI family penicillinase repressor